MIFVPDPLPFATSIPRAHLLSNGRYAVMLTAAGSGYSQWLGCAITRWREDVTCDPWGSYVLLRDVASGQAWSAGHQPMGTAPDEYAVAFAQDSAVITRRDGAITTTTEVLVVAGSDAEVRRLSLFNHGDIEREIEITTYAELVLAPAGSDAAHPAFSKLFVQTEYLPAQQLLLATRRRRGPGEQAIWAAQWLDVDGEAGNDQHPGALQWNTDRASFIGRSRTLRAPAALAGDTALDGCTGTVLDPVFSLRRRVRVAPGATARLLLWTAAAPSRDEVRVLAQRCRSLAFAQQRDAARQRAQASLQMLGIDAMQARRLQRLATALLYSDPALRADPVALAQGAGGAPTLWAGGISGDHPIVLLRICSDAGLALLEELLRAQAFWADKRLAADLVLLNEAPQSAVAALDDALQARIRTYTASHAGTDAKPTVFALRDDLVAAQLRAGLLTAARIVLDQRRGTLADQVDALSVRDVVQSQPQSRVPSCANRSGPLDTSIEDHLEYFNGHGGFDDDGREFVTIVRDGRLPPAPWLNVVANPDFGFTATEAGGGYAWSLNSQQNPLTPWANDPVSDPPQEVLYVRDDEDGSVWTTTVLPDCDPAGEYVVRHGQGYSRFHRQAYGIELELLQYVPVADSLKISRLRLRNRSGRMRRLSITAFVQWALGPNGSQSAPFIVTSLDAATGALFARNAWRAEFGQRTAFIDLCGRQTSHTGDRTEFLGRHGALQWPAALAHGSALSGRVGAGLDPCGALQTQLELGADSESEIVLLLGDAADADAAQELLRRYRDADLDQVLQTVTRQWNDTLETVQVRTPDRAMDLLLNRWLLYQTLACRVWARTAYYQASGAYGFRDQLQDVMALCVARPELAREHLLRAAGRQFVEGDVQHWWLPPGGAGVRTRMTDDRLWLPYVACHYLTVTADHAVLDTRQPFLAGDLLKSGQEDTFSRPSPAVQDGSMQDNSLQDGSLYEHCARAIDISLTLGVHDLPLFGTGDWNDGMNRVGALGRGESVWLGWFLVATIDAFVPHAQARGDTGRVQRWLACAATVRKALDQAGWDGRWYRRGYYDDGTPLGSQLSSECRIDTIAQSWSVIAGGCDPEHATAAMSAVDEHLIRRDDKLALLFTPPFDHVDEDPGYIKAYPPGIRENGGQYTHGATWSIFALAKMGQGDRAAELFALINPIHHADTPEAIERYKVEPYVACADVYSVAPHVGRGGWTWYSGSAAWLYRAGIEAILGFHREGDRLRIDPCIPRDWPGFSIVYRHGSSRYLIEVGNPHGGGHGVAKAELDGVAVAIDPCRIALHDDGGVHRVAIELGH